MSSSDDNKKILDGLDVRLALGEIDLDTYNALKAKFSQQSDQSKKDHVAETVAALPKEAAIIRCPGCTAPIPAPEDPSTQRVTCEYCGSSFVLQTAVSEMENLKSGIRKWISELAGASGSGGGGMDQAARGYIFREKILPALKMAADRATEMYWFGRHKAMFSIPIAQAVGNSPFSEALASSPDLDNLVGKIKETIGRVQAPEIQAFAMSDSDKSFLALTELQCQEIIYMTNARRQLSHFNEDGINKCLANLEGLEVLYRKAEQSAQGTNGAFSKFTAAMARRTKSISDAVKILGELNVESDHVDVVHVTGLLEAIAFACDKAALDFETCGLEPKQTVPATEGARHDAQAIRLFSSTVQLFGLCGAEIGESFDKFQKSLEVLVTSIKPPRADTQWLSSFLPKLYTHIASMSGDQAVALIDNMNWVDTRANAGALSSFFGGRESVSVTQRFFIPFWIARISFAQQTGFILSKGQAAEAMLLVNASRHDNETLTLATTDSFYSEIKSSFEKEVTIGSSRRALMPIITIETARSKMKAVINGEPKYAGGTADIRGLVYLPAAIVTYASKKAQRAKVLVPFDSEVGTLRIVDKKFGSRQISLAE